MIATEATIVNLGHARCLLMENNNVDSKNTLVLRPGITNPQLWYPERPPKVEWDRIRNNVLERDNYTCQTCNHKAHKYMNIHHSEQTSDNTYKNLNTICVACHSILHMGRNIELGIIEIWSTHFSQADIVRKTRDGIKNGLSYTDINKQFDLMLGPYSPSSSEYANDLIRKMGNAPRAYLDEPLCAIFVNLKRWQLE